MRAAREEALSHAAWRLIRHRFRLSPNAARTTRNADVLMSALGYATGAGATFARPPRSAGASVHHPRGCGRPDCHESALTDSRRGSTEGITQPFAYLVNILSRWLANDCRSLLLNAGGPPVCIPLARNVSMKSRMLSRWRMVSVE